MSHPAGTTDLASLSALSRHSSVSAIPRPTSGTSRHATPTSSRRGGATVDPDTYSFNPSHRHRKSWHPNDGAPPTSFHLPQSSWASSETFSPYKHQAKGDHAQQQQQLHYQKSSTQAFNNPGDVSTNPQGAHPRPIPRSRTMDNLLPAPQNVTPRRGLLQPLGPPLPRTHTLGNISCFGPSSTTPSPRKPTSIAMSQRRQQDDSSKMNVADALLESRMTKEEIGMMRQAQREAGVHRTQLRNSFGASIKTAKPGAVHCETSKGPCPIQTGPIATVKPSVNDIVHSGLLEKLQQSSSCRRLLFTDPAIANKDHSDSGPPTTSTLTGTASSEQSKELRLHIKQVRSQNRLLQLCSYESS